MPKFLLYLGAVSALAVAVLAGSVCFNAGEPETVTKASAEDIHEILSSNVEEVLRQIALENVEVSLPVDDKAARVLVRVEKGNLEKVPEFIIIEHRSRRLEIPLEVSETYELYEAQ